MPLCLGDEASPDVEVLDGPFVWAGEQDIVRHDIVVAKRRHNGYLERLGGVLPILAIAKDLGQLLHHELVLRDDFILRAGVFLVVVVACRVAGPDDEVDVVGDMLFYPVERCVDEGDGRVACRRFGAVVASGPMFVVAGGRRLGAGVGPVVRVGMEVCVDVVSYRIYLCDLCCSMAGRKDKAAGLTSDVQEAPSQRAALVHCRWRTCACAHLRGEQGSEQRLRRPQHGSLGTGLRVEACDEVVNVARSL